MKGNWIELEWGKIPACITITHLWQRRVNAPGYTAYSPIVLLDS